MTVVEDYFSFGQKLEELYGYVGTYPVPQYDASLRALPGDLVRYDTETKAVMEILKRSTLRIPGVLKLSSKVVEGFHKRSKLPLKRFVPDKSRYPAFKVKVPKSKLNVKRDVYIVISFSEWDKHAAIPTGIIEDVIGEVGEPHSELEYLKCRNQIRWRRYRDFEVKAYSQDLTPERRDLTDRHAVSIDPEGCQDVDDALHILKLEEDLFEVGVHIADVSSYIPKGSPVDQEARQRGETAYLVQQQNNMLPDELATDLCSLKRDQAKRSFSILFTVTSDGKILESWIGKSTVVVKENYSYDLAQKLVNETDSELTMLYNLARKLGGYELDYDTHKMVEVMMVMANRTVAERFAQKAPHRGIFRKHAGTSMPQFSDPATQEVERRAWIRKLARANYVVGVGDGVRHNSLGLEYYTHFTSPIRRYADILVHRALFLILQDTEPEDFAQICTHLNEAHKLMDRAQRESEMLRVVYDIYHGSNSILDVVKAQVVGVRDNYIQVYIPELGVEGDCKIVSHKVKHVVKYTSTEDSINVEDGPTIRLFDEVYVRVIISMKALSVRKKFLVQFLDLSKN